MAITQNTYTGNGATVLYSFTFPYLETTDVKVTINGTPTTAYTFANATTIQFNTAPANGAAIRIYRDTDDASLAATFYSGSAIRAQDLNDNFTQNLYVTQEVNNNAVNIDGSNPMVGNLNMNGFQIDNLAAPTSDTDAVNRAYINDIVANGIGDGDKGDIVVSGSGTTFTIDSGAIIDSKVNANANIVSSKLAFTQAGTGAVQRTTESKLQDVVSVDDFIPTGIDTTATDCTAYIQAALDSSSCVVIPASTYVVAGTIVVETSKILKIDGQLSRTGASTDPIIRVSGANATITGGGTVYTPNNSPHGIILVGTIDPTTTGQNNILWNKIEKIHVVGFNSVGSGSCGIRFNSEEGYGTSSQANYFNWVTDARITQVDYGVFLSAQCNGQVLQGLQFYRIGVDCLHMNGDVGIAPSTGLSDCLVSNITAHGSGSLQNIVYLNNANRNSFSNIGGEPGSGRLFNFTASTGANHFDGYDNCPNSSIRLSSTNTVFRNGTAYASEVNTPKVDATEVIGDKVFANTTTSATDTGAVLVSSGRSELDRVTRFRKTSTGTSNMSFTISFANPGSGTYYPFAVEIFVAYTGNSVPRGSAIVIVSGQIFNGNVGAATSSVLAGGGSSIGAPTLTPSGLDLTIELPTFSSSSHRGVAEVRVISWGGVTGVS